VSDIILTFTAIMDILPSERITLSLPEFSGTDGAAFDATCVTTLNPKP
jgi:hypothetical protein